jgi:hypothetical protein
MEDVDLGSIVPTCDCQVQQKSRRREAARIRDDVRERAAPARLFLYESLLTKIPGQR